MQCLFVAHNKYYKFTEEVVAVIMIMSCFGYMKLLINNSLSQLTLPSPSLFLTLVLVGIMIMTLCIQISHKKSTHKVYSNIIF